MLRHWIEVRTATLSEVAAATGLARSKLSALHARERKFSLTHLGPLARYFAVEPAVFLD